LSRTFSGSAEPCVFDLAFPRRSPERDFDARDERGQDGFDYLVCLLFDVNGDVEGAWGLTVAEVRVHAHSTVTGTSGKRTTKLAIRGEWKQHAGRITLSS
jgi:hypothetical protein